MKLTDIIKGSEYDLSLFTEAQISELKRAHPINLGD